MSQAIPDPLTVAQQAFTHFARGLATGQWQEFLDMLTEDFTFSFPVPPYQGENVGKAKAAAFFEYVSQKVFPQGLSVRIERIASSETTVIFELQSWGEMFGHPYNNQAAIAFDVRGDRICAYREYLAVIYQIQKNVNSTNDKIY